MTSVVSLLNAVLTFLFGLVHGALKWLGPFGSLVALSFLGGILLVWIFGKVSNQDAIRRTRSRLSAELIALRLFKDDLRVFFRVQGQVLVWTLKYLRHSILPMCLLMMPAVAILIQLNLHYGVRPLAVGETCLVKVKVRDAGVLAREVGPTIEAPPNLKVETEGVRIAELREVVWRVRGVAPGRFDLGVNVGGERVAKQMAVGGRLEGVSAVRTGGPWWTNLLYPGEAPILPTSPIESIEILYPPLDLAFLGWPMDWLIVFFVLSLAFGYAFKGVLGVHI
ncbi:MAG TPA: hypothetical protein VNO52_03725 [Methylomirabilota bacterium]|nr:hypothetical protein [Methylomirabilota bacterium]